MKCVIADGLQQHPAVPSAPGIDPQTRLCLVRMGAEVLPVSVLTPCPCFGTVLSLGTCRSTALGLQGWAVPITDAKGPLPS